MTRWMAAACIGLAHAAQAAPEPKKPDLQAVERAVLAGTNELRREHGLPALRRNAQLARAARDFADFMAQRDEYGHEADGRTPTQRARAAGYRDCMVAENISYQMRSRGFETSDLAERLVKGWATSPGHRRNMLDEEAVEIGIAVAHSDETSRYYGVQLFGRPESMRVTFEVRNESRDSVTYKVGDENHSLAGRSTRRHHICGDLPLVIIKKGAERRFKPRADDRFTVTPGGNVDHQPGD
jgi:uncharacterized protein YkwD